MRYTKHLPEKRPLLIWDGTCGLCKWWAYHFRYLLDNRIALETSQEARKRISDITDQEFEEAVFLIEKDGRVTQGAEAAFRSFYIFDRFTYLYNWYHKSAWFRKLCDRFYKRVAHNRPFYFKVTKGLYGSDPLRTKPYWLIYIIVVFFLLFYREFN